MDASSPRPQRPAADAGAVPIQYPGAVSGNPEGRSSRTEPGRDSWEGLRRIGVFGGSFDPVHLGHLHVAATAQAARGLERVLFLPAAQPPHKPEQILASGADRLAMLELALHGHRDWVADGLELDRPGPSYTIDTVRQLRGRLGLHADARLFLLLGSDNLRGFAQWKDIGELLELSEPVIVARERDLRPALESLQRESSPALAARLGHALVACAPFEASSSAIRERLSRGEIPRDVLPERVAEYITSRGIYGARKRLPPPPG